MKIVRAGKPYEQWDAWRIHLWSCGSCGTVVKFEAHDHAIHHRVVITCKGDRCWHEQVSSFCPTCAGVREWHRHTLMDEAEYQQREAGAQ